MGIRRRVPMRSSRQALRASSSDAAIPIRVCADAE
jgi:hypothetical protein